MSNVNHRYSSESWTLDLSGKRSPLSRWTGQALLRNEQFRLSLLGAEVGTAPVVWLAGDRACFEDLHRTLETYVQQGLSQPVLAASSKFPTGDSSYKAEANHTKTNHTEPPHTASSPENSQFSLQALGRLRHSLSYSPSYSPNNESNPRQMQLSMLQLADLLAILDQWQTDTLPLPERQPRFKVLPGGKDQDFAMPTWGRIAASLVVALGATSLGGYYLISQGLGNSDTQVAFESVPETATSESATAANPSFGANANDAFGQFPTNSGPPITSQAQVGDAAFNNPLILPKEAEENLPPSLNFPTPLPNESNLGQIPLPQTQSADASLADGLPTQANLPNRSESDDLTIASADIGSRSNASLPTQPASPPSSTADLGTGNTVFTPIPETIIAAEPPLTTDLPFENDLPLLRDNQPKTDAALDSGGEDEVSLASAPPLIQQPSSELLLDPALEESSKATAGISAVEDTNEARASAPVIANRQSQPIIESEPILAVPPSAATASSEVTSAPAAPPAPQVIVAKPLPGNNQSRAVQTYLQSQWKPLATIQQPLQYRLNISPSGDLATVEALSPNAQLYINDAKLPPLGSKISGAADNVQSTLVVTLTPTGQVKVDVEKATLSAQ